MKNTILLLTIFIVCSTGNSQELSMDHDSHVELISQFIISLNDNDFANTIELFDYNIMKFDYQQFSTIMTVLFPISTAQGYPNIDYYNEILRKSNSIREIQRFISGFLLPERYHNILEQRTYPWPTSSSETFKEEDIIEFLSYLDFTRLESLEIISIELSEPILQFSQRYRNNVEIFSFVYGYSDLVEYLVHYSFEGNNYIGGITLGKYDDRWYIHNLSSSLGNILLGRIRRIE